MILIEQKIRIYTDNQNLTYTFLNTDRVLRQRLILEEFGPDIEYIKGEENIVSDAISRFTLNGNQETTHQPTNQKEIMT